ncbi:hypothetical protein J4D99_20545 [Siccationidurans ginsengisoli]|uniref:hypothetical protein n=1 Tax=Hymenobacter TaxID=89966 RepID=UPI001AAD66B9|nr:hypothetical protein [Hymenobacter sp. BT559]MBO2033793.1 hypothetical protein [Hymenobacter sp. BT559]
MVPFFTLPGAIFHANGAIPLVVECRFSRCTVLFFTQIIKLKIYNSMSYARLNNEDKEELKKTEEFSAFFRAF